MVPRDASLADLQTLLATAEGGDGVIWSGRSRARCTPDDTLVVCS